MTALFRTSWAASSKRLTFTTKGSSKCARAASEGCAPVWAGTVRSSMRYGRRPLGMAGRPLLGLAPRRDRPPQGRPRRRALRVLAGGARRRLPSPRACGMDARAGPGRDPSAHRAPRPPAAQLRLAPSRGRGHPRDACSGQPLRLLARGDRGLTPRRRHPLGQECRIAERSAPRFHCERRRRPSISRKLQAGARDPPVCTR